MKNKYNILPLIEASLLFVLLFIKLFSFEKNINYGDYALPISLITIVFVFIVYYLFYLISKKYPNGILLSLHFVISFIIFIDALYFSYFGKLPSVASLSSAGYLGNVMSSIVDLMTMDVVKYIIDVPLILIYLINFRNKLYIKLEPKEEKKLIYGRYGHIVLAFFGLIIVSVSALSILSLDFKARYFKNELLIYHIDDIATVILGNDQSFEIKEEDYISTPPENTETNEHDKYYGIAKGRNLVTVQVEALQNFVIGLELDGQEVTPNLNALIKNDTLYFENYYYIVGGGNTSDAEFSINNSLYSSDTEASYVKYQNNTFYGLPHILKDNGYSGAYAFHAYYGEYWNREAAYVNQGFDDYTSAEDFSEGEIVGMGISDDEFFKQSVNIMTSYEEPFYAFLITLSSHHPYAIPAELYELNLSDELNGTELGNYLQTIHYVDKCIGNLIQYLKDAGLYDNCVLSIYGDHFGVLNNSENNAAMTKLLGTFYYEDFIFNVPMIINIPGGGITETVTTCASHVDYLPTMLHMLSYSNNKSIMFGNNIFTTPDNIVYQQMHVSRGSFITDDVFFVYPRNGIYTNTKVFDKNTGNFTELKEEYDEIAMSAIEAYNKCMYMLDNDLIVNEGAPSGSPTLIRDEILFAADDIDYRSTAEGKYYGVAKGKNLITIQVEALQNFVIGLEYNGREVTPNLNALIKNDTLYFENYYYIVGGGNTADAEFSINNSLYSPIDEAAYIKYQDNAYYGLPHILKDNGYSGAYAFHAYKSSFWNREKAYVNQGFDDYISAEDLKSGINIGMGLGDGDFFSQSVEKMTVFKEPFYAFLITLSSHHPYIIPQKYSELELLPKHKGTELGNYLQAINYTDKCIGEFLQLLKDKGLYDRSVISIYGDHAGMINTSSNNKAMIDLLGSNYYEDVIFNVPMLIHIPGLGTTETVSTCMSHVDYLPTMLHMLSYINEKGTMFGENIFENKKNIVFQQMHVTRGSFISDDVFFVYSGKGIFSESKVFDKSTGSFTDLVPEYESIANEALDEINECMELLNANAVIKK